MAGKQQPATDAALALIRAGVPLRSAAALHGLAPSTLVRACQRHGIALPRGRRPRAVPVE